MARLQVGALPSCTHAYKVQVDLSREDPERPPRLERLRPGSRGASSGILGKLLVDSGPYREHSIVEVHWTRVWALESDKPGLEPKPCHFLAM